MTLHRTNCELCGQWFEKDVPTRDHMPDYCDYCREMAKVGDEMKAELDRIVRDGDE